MSTCIAPGWGTGQYGTSPWGGGLNAVPGGHIPSLNPFDLYCVGPCGPMSVILTYDEVSVLGDGLQFFVDGTSLDQVIGSGGSFPTADGRIIITTSVPSRFTVDFTVNFAHLPIDFSSLSTKHISISVTDAAGPCVTLFFSKIGIGYAGAVHHDGSDNLVLDSTFQTLPGSQTLIAENEYYSVRVAADLQTGVVYIFFTKTSDLMLIGHQLRYIMPVIPASALAFPTTDRTLISVRGTASQPSELSLDSICLGSSFIIPNAAPIADAGLDQAVRTCSIVQLDGTRSFDPEGASLTYKWRLVDAPIGSTFMFDGLDGISHPLPMPTGFTNKFYSSTLGVLDGLDPIVTTAGFGDVLVVDGEPFDIIGKGTDGSGFFVQIDGFILPDSLVTAPFKLLRQRSISGISSSKPTFFPDLPGVFKLDLVVFDGGLFSETSTSIINVTESPIPRGCIPDVRFLWGYLSDFWRLVEDKERIETFWSAAAQVAATELLSLWQIDYSKSLRDAQRTFQRRWLNYELNINEPFPELSAIRPAFSGLRQVFPAAGISGIPGTTLSFTVPFFGADGVSNLTVTHTFLGSGVLTVQQVADQLAPFLHLVDKRFNVRVTSNRVPPGLSAQSELRIEAPFSFHAETASTAPIFLAPNNNSEPTGTGAGVGLKTYKVDRSLQGLDITEGDILNINSIGYRIRGLVDDPGDEWPFQRITTLDELPTTPGTTWTIPGKVTSKIINFYRSAIDTHDLSFFEIFDKSTKRLLILRLQGACAVENAQTSVGVTGLGILANYINHPTRLFGVYFKSATRLTHLPIDDLISDIPYLQEKIKSTDDSAVLRRNIDFYLESFRGQNSIRFTFNGFDVTPNIWGDVNELPERLWAETTYIDNRPVIEQNFGIPVEFTLDDLSQLPNNVDYLSAVRGLWYSYFNGPTLFNLRAGTQILLGLPFAEETGIIAEIRDDFSVTQGRILVKDKKNPEITRSYTYPVSLSLETNALTGKPYAVGDTVSQFSPLVKGVEVIDYVKDPTWYEGYLQQGAFFEVEKFFKFLVRIDSAAFNLSALLFVKSFILRIKPTYTFPLFVAIERLGANGDTEVSTTDLVEKSGKLLLFDGACFQYNGANTLGMSTMLDEPDPSGGGWQSQLDTDFNQLTPPPTYPVSQGVAWGLDKNMLCPEDFILASACVTFGGATFPTMDSIFAWDTYVSATKFGLFEDSWVTFVPAAPGGITLFDTVTVAGNGTITDVNLRLDGDFGTTGANFKLYIVLNGADQAPIAFTQMAGIFVFHSTVNIPVVIGDTLSIRIAPNGGVTTRSVYWKSVQVELGATILWALDVQLGAGTYCTYRTL